MSNRKKKKPVPHYSYDNAAHVTIDNWANRNKQVNANQYNKAVSKFRRQYASAPQHWNTFVKQSNAVQQAGMDNYNASQGDALRMSVQSRIDNATQGRGAALGVRNAPDGPQMASMGTVNGQNIVALPEPVKAEETPLTWFLTSLGSGYMHLNHDLTHPLTSLFLAANPMYGQNHGGGFQWSKAWHDTSAKDFRSLEPKNLEGGDAISLGQAAVSNPYNTGVLLRGNALNNELNNGMSQREADLKAGIGDPTSAEFQSERERQREDSPGFLGMHLDPYDIASGGTDTAQQAIGDGLALVAAAFKTARSASRITVAAKDGVKQFENMRYIGKLLEASRDGISNNAVGNWANELTNAKSISHVQELLKSKKIFGHDDVASLFVSAKTREHTDLLIRAGIGDPNAMKALKEGYQRDYAVFMARDQETADRLAQWDTYLPGMSVPEGKVASGDRLLSVNTGANAAPDHRAYPWDSAPGRSDAGNFVPENSAKYIFDSSSGKPVLADSVEYSASGAGKPTMRIKSHLLDQVAVDKWHSFDTSPLPDWVKNMRDSKDFREGYMRARANADPSLAEGLMMATNPQMTINHSMMMADFGSKIPGVWRAEDKISRSAALTKAQNTFRFKDDHTNTSWTGGGASKSDPGQLSFHQGGRLEPMISLLRWNFREHPTGTYGFKGVMRDSTLPEATASMNAVPSLQDAAGGVFKEQQKLNLAQSLHSAETASAAIDQHEIDMIAAIADRHVETYLGLKGIHEGDEGYKAARETFINDKVDAVKILQVRRDEATKTFIDKGGFMFDVKSGTNLVSPQLAEQLRTSKAVLDFKALDKQMQEAIHGDGTWMTKTLHKTGDTAYALNEGFQSLWRPVTLLRAAYPVRNTIEGFSRVLGFVGAHAVMNSMGETAGNIAVNATRKVGRTGKINRAMNVVTADVRRAVNRREALVSAEKSLAEMPPEELLKHAELENAVKSLRAEVKMFDEQALKSQERLNKVSTFKRIGEKDAFGTKGGLAAYRRASNDKTWSVVTTGATDARVTNLRRKMLVVNDEISIADGVDTYAASANKFFNHILVGNRVTRQRLDSTVTPEAFYKWFIGSRDARTELAAHQSLGLDVADEAGVKAWFQAGRENLMATIPDERMRGLIAEGKQIGDGEILAFVERNKEILPPINGEKVMAYHGPRRSGMRWWKDFTGKMFHLVGSVPEQVLVRAPYYRARWSEYLDQIGHTLPKDAGEDAWAKAYLEAHRYATHRMNRDLYTIVRQKNLTAAVEKISPFWTAQVNTLATWPRILWENPKAIAGIAKAYVRAREGGFVDDDGWFHPLPGVHFGSGPGSLDIKIPFSNVMSVFAGNLNTETSNMIASVTGESDAEHPGMLSGFLASVFPGPGPLMSAAGSFEQNHELLRGMGVPDSILDPAHRWLNNYGPSDDSRAWDKLVPGYVRTFHDALDTSSAASTTTQVQIMQVEYEKYQMGLRKDPPTAEEVVSKARTIQLALAAGQWALPGSPRKLSPLQPMLAQWWEMQKQYGSTEAHARWNDMYGDDFLAVTSLTGTNKITGLQPNNASWRALRDNPELVSKIINSTGDPGTVQMLMGAQGYSQTDSKEYNTARRMMMNYTVDAAGSKAIVGRTPEEMAAQLKTSESWRTFREKVTIPLDAQKRILRQQFGSYANVPSKLKEDMTKYREAQVKQIGKDNPKWAAEWNEGPKKGRTAIKALTTITSDAKFMKQNGDDPYWVAVKRFLEARKTVESAVGGKIPKYGAQTPKETIKAIEKSSKAKGYSFSAESTAKFRQGIRDKAGKVGSEQWKQWQMAKYEAEVDRLRRNVKFADMHDSWFSNEGFDPNRFS